ncbi:uncharacterized protein LOC133203004 isoform X2 [Saccostrea echinata]|uniref:uncharacterized protein LOC133203004 isoform X2 n=1 Tax=Saccostrea echinata TaxID=191078 RepID=UPI002A823008|nr:uncharacterized protein LOC133203004 isoform X2 [Saccostrea echinata]
MKNANLTNSLDMSSELVKVRTIDKVASKNLEISDKKRGTVYGTKNQEVAVSNRSLREYRVPLSKLLHNRTVSTTGKGSRSDNLHKRLPVLPTSPEKHLNDGDKTTSLTQEGQYTDGGAQGQDRHSGREDTVHCKTTHPRVINNDIDYQRQNLRSSSEHRIGSYIYWESDTLVCQNSCVGNSDYDYHNDSTLSRNVDGIINCVGHPTEIYEDSLSPDGESKVKSSYETRGFSDIQELQDHAWEDLDTNQRNNSDIHKAKDQVVLCQTDKEIKGAQEYKENTGNETLCQGDLKGQPSGNYNTRRDQGLIIRGRDNTADGLPLISDFSRGNDFKEPRPYCGMNTQLAQTGNHSGEVGNKGTSVRKTLQKRGSADNSGTKSTTNIKKTAELNKTRKRKPDVLLQKDKIKDASTNTKEIESEQKSLDKLVCSNTQNRIKNQSHVTLHAKTETSEQLNVSEHQSRELVRTPPGLAKNRNEAGKTNVSSTCKRPGCKHSTLIGYKPKQKCSLAKHSQSYQKTLHSYTFPETANKDETLTCNSSSPTGSPSSASITETISKESEKVGDNTCCEIIIHAHCNSADFSRQQESSADNIKSDVFFYQTTVDGSDLNDINVNKNNGKPITVPAVDINGLTLQSSPNEKIKQSGSAPKHLTYNFEGHKNACEVSLHKIDNHESIMDPQTNNEMEIGCDSVSNDNNKGHERGTDQTSNVPDHIQLHGSKDEHKTGTKQCVSIQSSEQPRQGYISTIDSMNKHLDAEQRQHRRSKDISADNERKNKETRDEKAINLKPVKANTTSLIKDTGIQLKDDKESLTNRSGRQNINKQSTKIKTTNRQLASSVSSVPVPKNSKLYNARKLTGQSISVIKGTVKSPDGSTCTSSPTESCNSSTKTFSEGSNSPRSSMERSTESEPVDHDSHTPKSPKLRIHQTKTSRQRARNAAKESPTETKHLILSDSTEQGTKAANSNKVSKKTPVMTRKDISKNQDSVRASSLSPRLAVTRKLKSASVSPVLQKRTVTNTTHSPDLSKKVLKSPNLSRQKLTGPSGISRRDSRSSSASRSSKESTPDNSLNLSSTSRATLRLRGQNDAEKRPITTSSTNDKKQTSLPVNSLKTSKLKIPCANPKLQDKTGQNKTSTSVGVKTQRNVIPVRKTRTTTLLKSPNESPNMSRKTDKAKSGLSNKSHESIQNSQRVKSGYTKEHQPDLKKETNETDKIKHKSKDLGVNVDTNKQRKILSTKSEVKDEQVGKQGKQNSLALRKKSPSPVPKTRKIVSPQVQRKPNAKSPITSRKPVVDSILKSPELCRSKTIKGPNMRDHVVEKSMLPKSIKAPKKIDEKSSSRTEHKGNAELGVKDNTRLSLTTSKSDSKSTDSQPISKRKISGVQNATITSSTVRSKTIVPTSIPKTLPTKAANISKSHIDAKSNIPAPRTSTPILQSSTDMQRKNLSTTKTTSKNNIKPATDMKIKTDMRQVEKNILSKNDKIKRMRNEKMNKESSTTSPYLSRKSPNINVKKQEYTATSDENRCTLSMAEDGYSETISSISTDNLTQRCTTDSSQISSDVIKEKKRCEEFVSINSSSTLETNFGQKINEANKTGDVSTSSEEYWSASDDENLDNLSSLDITHSNKIQCFGPSQASYQDLHLGNIVGNTQEESSVVILKNSDENDSNKDHGKLSPALVPHNYFTGKEAPIVHNNEEMAMRLPAKEQSRESQHCNYHVQNANDRETNLKCNSKSGDNDHAIAKTIPLLENDVHKDSTDLIPSNITHPLNREQDREVLNVNSVRLCKKDKNQYVSTDIETKLQELTNLRDYFDERNDNSKLPVNEGSKGASQPVQRKKSFGNDQSKNTMDNLPNLSYENCVSAQQETMDGLCSSSNETSDQGFSSDSSTLEKTLTSTNDGGITVNFENVAPSCKESTSDSGPQVEDYDIKLNSYQNADICTSGENLSASEPNPTNQNSSNLSHTTRTDLESVSSDTSDQEGFESFDSDIGDSMMENGKCDIKFPMDSKTITAYTNSNMEIQRGPTKRITRQRRTFTRSERTARYETVTTKILSPKQCECVQETSETRAFELSVKANEIPQSSSCVVKSSHDNQVTAYTILSNVKENFINDEKSLCYDHNINSLSSFRTEQSTSLSGTLREKEGENIDYHDNCQNSNTQEVLTYSETTATQGDTQHVYASFILEDKTCQSVPNYSSNRLSDVNIVLKLQPEEDWVNIQRDTNSAICNNIQHEVNFTLELSPDQTNVSDSPNTNVTKSSSCESANSEDIKLCGISTGDKGNDYSKSESTSLKITDVNGFQHKQSGIKPQVHDFLTQESKEINTDRLSDNENHTESNVQISDITGVRPLDSQEILQNKTEKAARDSSNHDLINDDTTTTSPGTTPKENKFEPSILPENNDIDGQECNHVSDNANTQSTSVTDLGSSALSGGMSNTSQVKTTESLQTITEHKDRYSVESTDSVQDLKSNSNKATRVKNEMQTVVKKERDRQGIRRFTATVCLQDVQDSKEENRNKFRSRSKSPTGLKNEDGVESKQGVSCAGGNRVLEIRRNFLGKAAKINIPEPKIERNKPVSPSMQLNSRNLKWVNACGKWKRIAVDDNGNPLQGQLFPETTPVASDTLSEIKESENESKEKKEPAKNDQQQTVPFSDKRAMFEKPKPKQPPKVLPKPSEAKRRTVVSCLQQWKGRVADRRSREFDEKIDHVKEEKEQPSNKQLKSHIENIGSNDIKKCELFCQLESKEITRPVCVEKTNVQNSLDKSTKEMKNGNGSDNEKACKNISTPVTIDSSENVQKEITATEHRHADQTHNGISEQRLSEDKEKCKVENNYIEIPLIDAESSDLGMVKNETEEIQEEVKPDVDPCIPQENEESCLMRRDKASSRRREMNSIRAAGVWDAVVDNKRIQSTRNTTCDEKTAELESSDETTPTNTPKTRKIFANPEKGTNIPRFTPKLKAVKIKQEMFPLEGSQERAKSVTDSLKESLKTLNSSEDKDHNVKFQIDDSDEDGLNETPNLDYQFENKILYSPSIFGNYKNFQTHKHSNIGVQSFNMVGEYLDRHILPRQSDELLSEITEHEEVNGNNGGSNLNKGGQSSDSCLNPTKDKNAPVSYPVSQRNIYNRSQSLPTTSLSNAGQHRIIYRNGHFVIETAYEDRGEETFVEPDEDLSLESVEDTNTRFNSGRSYSEANLINSYHSPHSAIYDEDEDIDVFMRNENDVTVIENNNDGSSPNWHVLVKRRIKTEDHDGENRKSRPLSVDESQLQTHRVGSDSEEQSNTKKERKRPSENVKRRSASFRELGTAKLQRNSSFRKAQERGYLHSMRDSQRNDSVGNLSLTPSEYSVCSDSGRGKGQGFLQKVFKKNKPTEKSTDPNRSKDSGSRKMSLKGLFTKKSKGDFVTQRSVEELNISPPIAVFQGDMDIHVDSAPNSPYSSQFRRRHTSAEIYDGKAHSLPRKATAYQNSQKLSSENNSSSRLLAVQNLENHPKRPISPKPNNVLLPRRSSNVSLPSSPVRDQYDGPFRTSTSKLDSSDSASICSGGSSIVDASRYPPHIPESEMTPSNSNDSGIQRDVSFHSSSESVKTAQDSSGNVVRRRKSPSPRPERPKSEISVRWADLEESREITPVKRRESSRRSKQRPKSDLEDNIQLFDEMYEDVIDDYDFLTGSGSSIGEDDNKPFGSQICLLPYSSLQNLEKLGRLYSYDQKPSMRRMSTPHPIKTRLERTPRKQRRKNPLVRSHSMPESLDKLTKKKKFLSTIASSNLHREDVLYHYDNDSSSDEGSEFSGDQISLHEKSLASRLSASYLSTLRERPEPDTLTYAEALWDHITMDQEELGFRAGDVIEVADMSDKDWWWGAIDDREGWFPATFVRLRVNQEHSDLSLVAEDILEHSSPANRRISVINTDQARENVVNEIISAEREYVKHLKDVVEGYIRHARKREDMFSEDRISVIFGNMEDIYEFSQKFLEKIETSFVKDNPHLSQLGHCFLECSKEFEIYSDYCNNHPSASGELKDLYRNKKYRHFFEACRLLQEMIEIPLEGFLLTPVQKICKYPLQLNELLKYTPITHPDHAHIKGALEAMKKIATLINERKRKMESIEKLAYWQTAVEDWQGPDLLEDSSELIFAGEMNKVNSAGWSQERNFFLFDHQLVYCKKDLLKKNGYSYKGRIDLDDSEIIDIEDGKVKNAWKIHEISRDKWYLLVARSAAEKEKWMKAFTSERKRVKEDQENNFVPLYWKRMVLNKIKSSQEKQRSGGQVNYQKDFVRGMPSHATLPRSYGKKVQKKKGWFGFGNKKTK